MKIINILLILVALIGVIIFAVPGWIVCIVITKEKNEYNLKIAISLDQLGNVILGPLLNIVMKKRGGWLFGDEDETLSMAIALNYYMNNLTNLGGFFADMLEYIDPGHLQKAIEKCECKH